VVENHAAAVWSAGAMSHHSTATFHNMATGTFEVQTDNTWFSAPFINDGAFTKSAGPGTTTISALLDNAGTVTVETGTLKLQSGGTHTGDFVVDVGTTLWLAGGTHDLQLGSSVTGDGTVQVSTTVTVGGAFSISGPTLLTGGTMVFDTDTTLPTLTQSGGSIQGGATLTVQGPLTWTAGNMRGDGTTIANGGLDMGGSTKQLLDSRVLENNGAATWSAGIVSNHASATFHNTATGSFEAQSDNSWFSAPFINDGVFTKSAGAGTTTISGAFDNGGTVNVDAGTLKLANGGVHTADFVVDAGTTLWFSGGIHDLEPGSSVTGDGTVQVSSTVNVDGSFAISGPTLLTAGSFVVNANTTLSTLTQSSGSVQGGATLTVQGLLTWTAGSMRGDGTTIANGGMNLSGSTKQILDNRVVENHGAAAWSAGAMSHHASATFRNMANGSFDVQADISWFTAPFINEGTFTKSAGAGTTTISAPFDNTGTVNVQTGILQLSAASAYTQSSGLTTVAQGAELEVPIGIADFQGGALGGHGLVDAVVQNGAASVEPGGSPGTLTVEGDYTQNTDGRLDIELGGLIPGDEHDVLAVDGDATLGGTLGLTLYDGYLPQMGDEFTVLTTTGQVFEQFDFVECADLFQVTYLLDAVVVSVVGEPKLGDLDCDGVVGINDFLILLAVWGACPDPCPPACLGDLDDNCDVGVTDFLVMLANWG
jgi:hypothetical protein